MPRATHFQLADASRAAWLVGALLALVAPTAAQYHSYAEIGQRLADAEARFPDLCERHLLGQSEQGRQIWALRITDRLDLEEDEPEVKLIGSMHGDEWVAHEMLLFLIDELLSQYETDPRITRLVDELDLWIVPLMNPDGYAANSRFNADGVDLNRDFPCPFTSPNNSPAGRAAETAAIMQWSFEEAFVLSANVHSGALVVNYPFDANAASHSVYTSTPDDDLMIYISEEYARHNPPMQNSFTFPGGITNGAAWYAVYGTMQDWSYRYMGCNEVTLELSNTKRPAATTLPGYWDDNRESFLAYLETALIGIRGVVYDAETTQPLAAGIRIVGRDHLVFTDPDVGDYHRMALPGTYDLVVSADGFDRMRLDGVTVDAGPATVRNIPLYTRPEIIKPAPSARLVAHRPAKIRWTGADAAAFEVQYTLNADAIIRDLVDFEDDTFPADFASGGHADWYVTSSDAYVGQRSARAGEIGDSQLSWLTGSVTGGDLRFAYRVSSEDGYDFFNFYIDDELQFSASGDSGWREFEVTLPDGPHALRWEYEKDFSVSAGADTVWIDEIEWTRNEVQWEPLIRRTAAGVQEVAWTPPATSDAAKVRIRAHYPGNLRGTWTLSDEAFSIAAGPKIDDYRSARGPGRRQTRP